MNKEKALGLFREMLVAGGALAFGAFQGMPSLIGLLVAVAAVIWAFYYHEGIQIVGTSLRKALSATPGTLLALDLVSAETAASLTALIAPLFAMVWSFIVNSKDADPFFPGGYTPLAIFGICCMSLMFPSCAFDAGEQGIRGPVSGAVYKTDPETGKTRPVVDNQTVVSWFEKLQRVLAGEKARDVIIPLKHK